MTEVFAFITIFFHRHLALKLDLADSHRLLGSFQAERERLSLLVGTAVIGVETDAKNKTSV